MHFEGKTLNSSQWHTLYSKSTTHDFGDRRPLIWCINIVATLFSLCWEPSYSNGSLAGGLLNDLIWDLLMKVSASQMASITLRLEPLLYHLTHSKEAELDSALKMTLCSLWTGSHQANFNGKRDLTDVACFFSQWWTPRPPLNGQLLKANWSNLCLESLAL